MLLLYNTRDAYLFVAMHYIYIYNCPRDRFNISLVYAFRSRWKTNSHFDLGLLLFVMTLIFLYFIRFILHNHVIEFSVYVSFLRILLFRVKISLFLPGLYGIWYTGIFVFRFFSQ